MAWTTGRADGAARGWLIGHFAPAGDMRHSDDVEVKWGVHPAGEERAGWAAGDWRHTFTALVRGRFVVNVDDGQQLQRVELTIPGDYVLWGSVGASEPGPRHTWRAVEDSVMITVRWPSRPPGQGDG